MNTLPQCTIPFTAEEIDHFDQWSHEQTAEEHIPEILSADCWAAVIVRNGESFVGFNAYAHPHREGRGSNWSFFDEELSAGDRIDVYMFGAPQSWRVAFTKTATGYDHRLFKTTEGLYPPWHALYRDE